MSVSSTFVVSVIVRFDVRVVVRVIIRVVREASESSLLSESSMSSSWLPESFPESPELPESPLKSLRFQITLFKLRTVKPYSLVYNNF